MNMINRLSIFAALFACIINTFLSGYYVGFARGCDFVPSFCIECMNFEIGSGQSFLLEAHALLSICLIAFALSRSLEENNLLRLFSIVSIIVAFFVYLRWIGLAVINSEYSFFSNLLRTTNVFDWVSFILVCGLLIYQTWVTVIRIFRN